MPVEDACYVHLCCAADESVLASVHQSSVFKAYSLILRQENSSVFDSQSYDRFYTKTCTG